MALIILSISSDFIIKDGERIKLFPDALTSTPLSQIALKMDPTESLSSGFFDFLSLTN